MPAATQDRADRKIVQYLHEAHATETTLLGVLVEQIAVAPKGAYRSALESHLQETRRHAERLERRFGEKGGGERPLQAVGGLAQALVGQALALLKAPLDLLRGSGGEEKVLKNAKDACATEALEIATYAALEQLAEAVGDTRTARLAASIRGEEQRMLDRILELLPDLADDVVSAEVHGEDTYDVASTGAADAARKAGGATRSTAKRGARQARKVPGVARAEGELKGVVASEQDLPIARYDSLNATVIVDKLSELSQIDLGKIDAYERRHDDRSTVLDRISSLRGDEPWPGYDEQNVSEVQTALSAGDDDLARRVRGYERSHKARAGVLQAAQAADRRADD